MQKDSNLKHGIPFGWHEPSQRMVTATEVANGRGCECICAACSVRLQARQGAIRVWHFAHDEETNCPHAGEAAIHRMAKQMIAERGSVFVPRRQNSRIIHGKKRVWTEAITVDVQSAGLQILGDCTQEKTIGDSRFAGEFRRPDIFALLEEHPLAIEIRNTHAILNELEHDYGFTKKMLAGLAKRTHDLMTDVEAYSLQSAKQRIIGYLMIDVPQAAIDSDKLEFELTAGKGVIASRLNITQEHFSRVLHDLSDSGLLEVHGKKIRIPSVSKLLKSQDNP